MKKLLVEIQASHVGVGKTTFCQKLGFPWIDDCIGLVESDPMFFYTNHRDVFGSDIDNEKLRAYLVLENAAATLDQADKSLDDNWIIVMSRSPLVSGKQFSRYDIDFNPLAEYYRKRLDHLKVDHVLVLDYGSSIQLNKHFIEEAYKRMLHRGRWFELNAFDSFKKYCEFFEKAEKEKKNIVEMYERDPQFYTYKEMPFNGFNPSDINDAKNAILQCKKRIIV